MLRITSALAFLSVAVQAYGSAQDERELWSRRTRDLKITVTNIANNQPMSPSFVAVHVEDFPSLYKLGEPAPMK